VLRVLGVKTIGNATLIAFDGGPLLATDPWLGGSGAYFGSWGLSHEIPPQERAEILAAPYVWFSHGHPDHLSAESLDAVRRATVLLPDHVGGRIRHELEAQGFGVRVLPDRRWVDLSPRVRICCVSDYYQDAILLVDVNGRLFVDLNDAKDRGFGAFVKRTVRGHRRSYLLKLANFGDADMIHFFDEAGRPIEPNAARRRPIGSHYTAQARLYGVTHVVPFSAFHVYQRTDSAWANAHVAPLGAHAEGFDPRAADLLPAFVEIDCETDAVRELSPPEHDGRLRPPEEFGDVWSDRLERDEAARLERYFREKELLREKFGFVTFRVGGREHRIELNRELGTGITFEVPRQSLVTAIQYEVFDDLLIGNFMKTTLHGVRSLHPHFTPVVARFGDQARVRTRAELRAYLAEYRRRAPRAFLLHALERESERRFRSFVSQDSPLFRLAKRAYVGVRGAR
jgi:hypothetical protein